MCDCVKIAYSTGDVALNTIEVNASGTYNGANYYTWTDAFNTYFLFWNFGQWEFSYTLGGASLAFIKDGFINCPDFSNAWITEVFTDLITDACSDCSCGITFTLNDGETSFTYELQPTGEIIGGQNVYQFTDDIGFGLQTYTIFFGTGAMWYLHDESDTQIAVLYLDSPCPIGTWVIDLMGWTMVSTSTICPDCGHEDRIFRKYQSIKLPQSFAEQDRGLADCCCVALVLGSSAESWKNDKTSFWMKLSDDLDSVTFDILDCVGNIIDSFNYTAFPNEPNAYYATCDWGQILSTYGQGNYSLGMTYSISGVSGTLLWGDYKLLPYSIKNALKTARVRAIFNGKQTIDDIDFTNSNVESTHRFYGYIGNRQPNMEIDNIIYDNREMKRVIRENLNDYEIITDPEDECILRPLLELFLISENELFISDYNAHNHSYRYLDLPTIVSESPTVEYKDFSRKAVLKCKVADKFKNSRTFY